jgi:hypothetical protein
MRVSLFALVALTIAASPVAAQDTQRVEVTPYVAVGSGGVAPVGVTFTVPVTSNLSVETDLGYRHGEGIHALSTSGSLLYFLPRVGRTRPYLAGGLGLAQYGAPLFSPNGIPVGTQSRLDVALVMGGGLKTRVNENVEQRTDVRYYQSLGRQGWQAFRVAHGVSFGAGKR